MVLKLFVMVLKLSVGALTLVLWGSAGPETGGSDLEPIKQTALDYAEGWYEGNAERMERALHPDLAKRTLTWDPRSGKGKITHLSALTLVQGTRAGTGTKTPREIRRADVTVLDVFGNAASVKLVMHDWVDYMHMSRIGGRWVVVNVLWELTPEARKKYGIPKDL